MNPLATFSSIIESDESPWKKSHLPDQKFRQLMETTPRKLLIHQIWYVPAFPDPLVPIQQYYVRLIENAFVEYLNEFLTLMEGASIETEQQYYVTTALDNEINQQLKDTAACFAARQLTSVTTVPELERLRAPAGTNNDAFIINVLKLYLLAIVSNIQELYPRFTTVLPKGASDLHLYCFYQPLADGFFKASAPIVIKKPAAKAVQKAPPFEPIMDDIEGRKPAPVAFRDFIASRPLLHKMEAYLVEEGYLTEQYYLTDKRKKNVKREICALILEMEGRGGFKEEAFIKNKRTKITPAHILAFFNARYQTELKDILNGMRRKDEQYVAFLDARTPIIKFIFNS